VVARLTPELDEVEYVPTDLQTSKHRAPPNESIQSRLLVASANEVTGLPSSQFRNLEKRFDTFSIIREDSDTEAPPLVGP
jgi:hypothetical protein